jgi:hypothetical protein
MKNRFVFIFKFRFFELLKRFKKSVSLEWMERLYRSVR